MKEREADVVHMACMKISFPDAPTPNPIFLVSCPLLIICR